MHGHRCEGDGHAPRGWCGGPTAVSSCEAAEAWGEAVMCGVLKHGATGGCRHGGDSWARPAHCLHEQQEQQRREQLGRQQWQPLSLFEPAVFPRASKDDLVGGCACAEPLIVQGGFEEVVMLAEDRPHHYHCGEGLPACKGWSEVAAAFDECWA